MSVSGPTMNYGDIARDNTRYALISGGITAAGAGGFAYAVARSNHYDRLGAPALAEASRIQASIPAMGAAEIASLRKSAAPSVAMSRRWVTVSCALIPVLVLGGATFFTTGLTAIVAHKQA